MAHFARVEGEPGSQVVREVVGVKNCAIGGCLAPDHPERLEHPEWHDDCGSMDFPETEELGQALLAESGAAGTFVQTSFNSNFRGKYAAQGDIWDGSNFIARTDGGA